MNAPVLILQGFERDVFGQGSHIDLAGLDVSLAGKNQKGADVAIEPADQVAGRGRQALLFRIACRHLLDRQTERVQWIPQAVGKAAGDFADFPQVAFLLQATIALRELAQAPRHAVEGNQGLPQLRRSRLFLHRGSERAAPHRDGRVRQPQQRCRHPVRQISRRQKPGQQKQQRAKKNPAFEGGQLFLHADPGDRNLSGEVRALQQERTLGAISQPDHQCFPLEIARGIRVPGQGAGRTWRATNLVDVGESGGLARAGLLRSARVVDDVAHHPALWGRLALRVALRVTNLLREYPLFEVDLHLPFLPGLFLPGTRRRRANRRQRHRRCRACHQLGHRRAHVERHRAHLIVQLFGERMH